MTEQVIRDVLEPLQRGIEEHNVAQVLAVFDPQETPDYAQLRDQMRAFFSQNDAVRFRYKVLQVTSEKDHGFAIAEIDMAATPSRRDQTGACSAAPRCASRSSPGAKGWKLVRIQAQRLLRPMKRYAILNSPSSASARSSWTAAGCCWFAAPPSRSRASGPFPAGCWSWARSSATASAAKSWRKPDSIVEPGEVLDVFDSIFTDGEGRTEYHYVLVDYLCRPISGEATAGTDVSDVRWVSEDDLPAMGLRDSIEQVVRKGLARS